MQEERILADQKLVRAGAQVAALLGACWQETLDLGPYTPNGKHIDWDNVLAGDRFYALMMIRVLTYGPDYAFSHSCRNDACRARIEWEVDLTKLPSRPLSAESRAAFVGGNRFPTTLPEAGRKVWFKLLTGADEKKLPALQRASPDRLLSSVLAYRIVEVEGVEPKDRRAFLEDLTMRDADFLVDEFDRVDCGVDTTIEIQCPECGTKQDIDLPFDSGFFLPGKERTARRKARSASSPT